MKDLRLIVWLTQLGISVAAPLGGFVWLAIWLRSRFDWGVWVIIVGVALGILAAVNGLRTSLQAMERMAGDRTEEKPPVSFNDHV